MDKPNSHTHEGFQAHSKKEPFLIWDKEYSHLRWGGLASIKSLQAYLLSKSTVLDAGSGNGRYLGELAKYYTAIGVDISQVALLCSRAHLTRSGRFAEHLKASVNILPFKDQSFNGILCYGVLQHLFCEERTATVAECKRVLLEGGYIFFEAFGSEDMRYGGKAPSKLEENTFIRQNGLIYHYFTVEEVRALFSEFETIELENKIKEKTFGKETFKRHMIKGIFRKL
jgi:ubiquinone/menaquinone biosynthesis C-methylase UbiE